MARPKKPRTTDQLQEIRTDIDILAVDSTDEVMSMRTSLSPKSSSVGQTGLRSGGGTRAQGHSGTVPRATSARSATIAASRCFRALSAKNWNRSLPQQPNSRNCPVEPSSTFNIRRNIVAGEH
jgi:hypothetical protein